VLGILSRFGKVGVGSFDAGVFWTVWELALQRGLAAIPGFIGFDSAFFHIFVAIVHRWFLVHGMEL
jgi:hypothetical protein